ncbi:MAG: plasmid recombination protein [Oscillospiraceae bacterium]|nr:plasmid recombination protein [Oscillospiraceae bacterium]
MAKTKVNSTVVRNAGYDKGGFSIRERHNERKNESYHNGDIVTERSELNINLLRRLHVDGTPFTYQQSYEKMLAEGTIVERGLKPDAKVFAELVFDVNTDYFEQNGGYDFAVKFYEEAFNLAIKEIGGTEYILSAVLHADERHSALSEQLGYDVYHYHLHVVYVPVVQKEILWSKRTKDKSLVGKVKEVIPQVSHSKKWPIRVPVERDGKIINVNSYSLLQDRYNEHMRAAGYDVERGERGSTREHLEVDEYKRQQEQKKLAVVSAQVEKKEARLDKLDAEIAVKEKAKATIKEVDGMGKPQTIGSGFIVTADELKKLKTLAKKSVNADKKLAEHIADSKKKIAALDEQITDLNLKLRDAQAEVNHWHREYKDLWNEVKDFIGAIRKFPARLKEFVSELFRPEREAAQRREQEQIQQSQQSHKTKKKSYGQEI